MKVIKTVAVPVIILATLTEACGLIMCHATSKLSGGRSRFRWLEGKTRGLFDKTMYWFDEL